MEDNQTDPKVTGCNNAANIDTPDRAELSVLEFKAEYISGSYTLWMRYKIGDAKPTTLSLAHVIPSPAYLPGAIAEFFTLPLNDFGFNEKG